MAVELEYAVLAPTVMERIAALEGTVAELTAQLDAQTRNDKACIICFSGEWDRLFAALTIAAGSLAMGKETHLFFTFWAVNALRSTCAPDSGEKSFLQAMFAKMLPRGPGRAPLSKFNLMGLGKRMMQSVMKQQGVDDIDVLFRDVVDLGAHIHVCETTADLFGLSCADVEAGDNVSECGVATFLSYAYQSQVLLFV